MKSNKKLRTIGKYLPLALAMTANAVTLPGSPDAGSVQKQIEQGLQTQAVPSTATKLPALPEIQSSVSGVTVTVKSFKFQGNSLRSDEVLAQAVQPFIDKSLNFDQLKLAAAAVTAAYRDAGWIVRAYLPKQEIEQGVVTIQVVESTFGKVIVADPQSKRVDASRLISVVGAALKNGEVVKTDRIDRALLLLDDTPGITVAGNFAAGQQPGETDLILKVLDRNLVNSNVSVDNFGSLSTGSNRVSANFAVNSPTLRGDAISLNLMKTQGVSFTRMGYTLPVGGDGWQVGGYASSMAYKLVGDFASLGSKGTSTVGGFNISYPLIRSQITNLNFTTTTEKKNMDNKSAEQTVSKYSLHTTSLGLSGSKVDELGGGGLNSFGLSLTSGRVNLDGSPNKEADLAGANTAGGYQKVNLTLNRTQTLTASTSAYVAVGAQRAQKNLESSERMYLGGTYGVRAYPSSEVGGSSGHTATFELREKISSTATVTGFYDYGKVKAYENNTTAAGGSNTNGMPNSAALKGYGVSVAWQPAEGSEIKVTAARRSGVNPWSNATTGMDGDGTRKTTRIWASASFSF